ncbi:MAG: M20/M25/M40 family metallo-hydrolase [Phycisphaerales bacterium]|nr:M20/M25/M40 family metallo-hydrolase [Phycisphaerales bacterium]
MRFSSNLAVAMMAGTCISLAACTSTSLISDDSNTTDDGSLNSQSFALIDDQQVPVPQIEMGDPETIAAIIEEGKNNTQALAILTEMCETFGPRLTGSSHLEESQKWARERFESFGMSNSHLHKWGEVETRFDRGPSSGRVLLASGRRSQEPREVRSLEFSTLAWSKGTDGPTTGSVIHLPSSMDEYESNKGAYANAWVLLQPNYAGRGGIRSTGFLMRERMDERHDIRKGMMEKSSQDTTMTDVDSNTWKGTFDYHGSMVPATFVLDETGEEAIGSMDIQNFSSGPISEFSRDGDSISFKWKHDMGTSNISLTIDNDEAKGLSTSASGNEFPLAFSKASSVAAQTELTEDETKQLVMAAVLSENPNGFVSSSKDERVWTTSSNDWRERKLADYPDDVEVNVRQSDYDYLSSRSSEGVDIQVEFDLQNNLFAGPYSVYDVIAEIPGTEKPDEVVIISAHMDSWDGPGSQGTTDNGTGTAVTIEAARILMAAGVQPKRTIRFALWGGEEQGLLGSKAYIESLTEEELSKISAAFVDDGGTNYEGGIPAADFMVDYLAAATAPVNNVFYSETDGEYLNVNIRPTGGKIETHGGSDHAAFNKVGVPGFFWDEEGRADYGYGWHTQNDRLDLAIEEYLMQSATNAAIVAYNLANAPGLLPREGDVFDQSEDSEEIEETASASN